MEAEANDSEWRIHDWMTGGAKPLRLSDILLVQQAPADAEASVAGMLWHAEVSYMSCRILFLASQQVHPAALYMAAQTIEKYLKAILISRAEPYRAHGHDIVALARAVGGRFGDVELLRVLESLRPFEVAGRYADGHDLEAWHYSLDLLSLLDVFAVRCREEIADLPDGYINRVAALYKQDSTSNEMMRAAETAVKDRNYMLQFLLKP